MIITCPHCERDLQAAKAFLGLRIRCPLCDTDFEARLPEAVAADEDAAGSVVPASADHYTTQQSVTVARVQEYTWHYEAVSLPNSVPEPMALPPVITAPAALPEPQRYILPQMMRPRPPAAAPVRRERPCREAAGGGEPAGWFVTTRDGEVGPFHIIQIAKAVGMGRIGPGTLLRNNYHNITVLACSVPGLFPDIVYNPAHHRLEQKQRPPAVSAAVSRN